MTAYRDRLLAGVYEPDKQDAKSQKAAQKKAEKLTAKRRAQATTTAKLKGLC